MAHPAPASARAVVPTLEGHAAASTRRPASARAAHGGFGRPPSARRPGRPTSAETARPRDPSGTPLPRPSRHDLDTRIDEAGLPKRYLRALKAQGFDDVEQLLHLVRRTGAASRTDQWSDLSTASRSCHRPLDVVFDGLKLAPGHRVIVGSWLEREASRVAKPRPGAGAAKKDDAALIAPSGPSAAEQEAWNQLLAMQRENAYLADRLRETQLLLQQARQSKSGGGGGDVDLPARILQRVLNREPQRLMRRALAQWEECVLLHRRRLRLRAAFREPSLGRAWRAWADRADALGHARRLGARVVARLRGAQTARALRSWRVMIEARHAAQRRVTLVLGRAMRAEAAPFAQWRRVATSRGRARRRLSRAGGHWARPEARLLMQWHAAAAALRRGKQRLAWAAARMRGGGLLRGFQQWARRHAAARVVRDVAGAALTRWANQKLVALWGRWRAVCARGRVASAVAQRWVHPELVRALQRWVCAAVRIAAARRALVHWHGGLLWRTFAAWLRAVAPARARLRWRRLRALMRGLRFVATHPRQDLHAMTHPVATLREYRQMRSSRSLRRLRGGAGGGGSSHQLELKRHSSSWLEALGEAEAADEAAAEPKHERKIAQRFSGSSPKGSGGGSHPRRSRRAKGSVAPMDD